MGAPCNRNVVLPVLWWINSVELMLPKGLEGHYFQYFQCILVQNIHVINGVYLQAESALPI